MAHMLCSWKTCKPHHTSFNSQTKICVSFERGDIDVRPSHAKSILFFDFFRCITRLAHFFSHVGSVALRRVVVRFLHTYAYTFQFVFVCLMLLAHCWQLHNNPALRSLKSNRAQRTSIVSHVDFRLLPSTCVCGISVLSLSMTVLPFAARTCRIRCWRGPWLCCSRPLWASFAI